MRITTSDKILTENDSEKPTVAPPNTSGGDKPDVVVVLREGQDESDIVRGTSMSLVFGLLGYALALPITIGALIAAIFLL